jgi:iron complex outermembrane recepter protein
MQHPQIGRNLIAITVVTTFCSSLNAQEPEQRRAMVLEEVVVTAERREASLQQTAISIAAFDEEMLRSIGAIESSDVSDYVPNVEMVKTAVSTSALAISIRGVASGESSLATDATVGVYVDGVYLGRNSVAAFEIVDLERIEVLRGPQGTLYGRNTTGGAINVITHKPTGEFGLVQDLSFADYDYFRSATSINTPSFGDFAAQFSFSHTERGGIAKSSYTSEELGDYEVETWRAALRWTPGDALTIDYVYDHYQDKTNVNLAQLSHVRPSHVAVAGDHYQQALAASSSERLNHLPFADSSKDQDFDMDGHALNIGWDLGPALLRSITSYREWDSTFDSAGFGEFPTDGVSVLTDDYNGTAVPAGVLVPTFDTFPAGDSDHKQWSQEMQVIGSALNDRLDYTLGLYYFHEEARQFDPQAYAYPATLALEGEDLPDFLLQFICGGDCLGKSFLLTAPDFEFSTDNDAYAAFGQFEYALSDSWSAILGLRWSKDEKKSTLMNEFADIGLETVTGKDSWDNFNPAFTLTYQLNSDAMLYGKVATGYRAGGYNIRATTSTSFLDPVDEENIVSFELGGKSEWWDRRLRLNGAVFHYQYEDRQVNQFEAGTGGASSIVVNAGEMDVTGLEVELTVLPTEGLMLQLNYGYLDPEHKEFITTVTNPVTGFPVTDESGDPLVTDISDFAATNVYSSEHSGSAIIQYTFPMTSFGTVVAQLDATYRDEMTFAYQNNLYDSADSQTLLNGRISLLDIPMPAGELGVALWGRNLTDEEVREWGIDFGQLGYAFNGYREMRTIGFDLNYRY